MKALVLTGDGVNCENETARALHMAGIDCDISQINDFLGKAQKLHDYYLLVLPGGFSYGDDLGSGKIFAKKIKSIFGREINNFVASKKPILGICNGFQVLCTLKMLDDKDYRIALEHNDNGHFINKWVDIDVPSSHCVWTKNISKLRLPIRHGEGKLVLDQTLSFATQREKLIESNNIALTYCENPNGSTLDIAGLTDSTGLVLGLMPHPEAATNPWHYPGHAEDQEHLGIALFENIKIYLKENF